MPSLLGLRNLTAMMTCLLRHPRRSARHLLLLPEAIRASAFCDRWGGHAAGQGRPAPPAGASGGDPDNPLWNYFASHKEGRGIFKWTHYFDIYHRHLGKFVGRDVHVVEVGVYGGGSLDMWRQYFGPNAHITGVDIEDACKAFEGSRTTIHIGDQADRSFWKRFREQSPPADVIIDDGGHRPEQQRVTLEEMLPHLRPGGVYVCEDVHGVGNRFAQYVYSVADRLNAFVRDPVGQGRGQLASIPTAIQASVRSVHLYPFVVVIERAEGPVDRFVAPKHGTEWQPFS
jgi:hypothetical protein